MAALIPGGMDGALGIERRKYIRKDWKMKKWMAVLLTWVLLVLLSFPSTRGQAETVTFEQPLVITSAGQNAEVQLAAILAKKAGLDYRLAKLATGADLENAKTLVLVLGASMKGLGAAGLDVEKERERVRTLTDEARKKGIPILCLHLGGESRRGQQTDDLMAEFLPLAKMAIVVKSGNADGFFTRVCGQKDIPLVEVERAADALEPFRKAFR